MLASYIILVTLKYPFHYNLNQTNIPINIQKCYFFIYIYLVTMTVHEIYMKTPAQPNIIQDRQIHNWCK